MPKTCLQCNVELPWIMGPQYCDRCATAQCRKDLGIGFTVHTLCGEQPKAPGPCQTQAVPSPRGAELLLQELERVPHLTSGHPVFLHKDCPICLKHNLLAALGALGYDMPGYHNGDFTDGRHPENGIAKAFDRRLLEAYKEIEQLKLRLEALQQTNVSLANENGKLTRRWAWMIAWVAASLPSTEHVRAGLLTSGAARTVQSAMIEAEKRG